LALASLANCRRDLQNEIAVLFVHAAIRTRPRTPGSGCLRCCARKGKKRLVDFHSGVTEHWVLSNELVVRRSPIHLGGHSPQEEDAASHGSGVLLHAAVETAGSIRHSLELARMGVSAVLLCGRIRPARGPAESPPTSQSLSSITTTTGTVAPRPSSTRSHHDDDAGRRYSNDTARPCQGVGGNPTRPASRAKTDASAGR